MTVNSILQSLPSNYFKDLSWNQFLPLSAAACQKYNQKECRTRCGPTSEQKSLLIHLLDRARSIVSAKQTIRYKLPLALEPSPNRWPEQNIAGYKSPQLDPSHIFSDIPFKCDICKKMCFLRSKVLHPFMKKRNIINTLYDTYIFELL